MPRVGFRHQRMTLGETLHMHLVDDSALPRHVHGLRDSPQVKAGSITRHFCIKGALSRSS